MIIEWLAGLGTSVGHWFLTLFPSDWQLPWWMSGFVTTLDGFVNNAANMGVWIPWGVLAGVVAFVTTLWGIGFGIKGLRWLIGLIPTMGGGS